MVDKIQRFYDLVKEKNTLESVYQDFQVFKDGVGGEMAYAKMMSQDTIAPAEKEALLLELIAYFSSDTQSFFKTAIRDGRYALVYRDIQQFIAIYNRHHLTITSAVALDESQIQSIIQKIGLKMNRSVDTYDTVIDSTILGGVKVQSGDFLLDATLATQLNVFLNEN